MKSKHIQIFGFCLILLSLLTACSINGLDKDNNNGELRNKHDVIWTLLASGTEDNLTPALPAPLVSLKFDFTSNTVSGSAGCNHYSASYKLRNSNLSIDQAMSTLMACLDNEAMQQESEFMMLLSQVIRYQIDGDVLFLFAENGEILQFQASEKTSPADE
jgi:heat shock protein HslJ